MNEDYTKVIDTLVEEMLRDQEYSYETQKNREKIKRFFHKHMEERCNQGLYPHEALADVLNNFGTLELVCKQLNIKLGKSRSLEDAQLRSYIRKMRWVSLLGAVGLSLLFAIMTGGLWEYHLFEIIGFVLGGAMLVFAFAFFVRHREYDYRHCSMSKEGYRGVERLNSIYRRKFFVSLILFVSIFVLEFGIIFNVYVFMKYSLWESLRSSNAWIISMGLLLVSWNGVELVCTMRLLGRKMNRLFYRYWKRFGAMTGVYWGIDILVWVGLSIFGKDGVNYVGVLMFGAIIYYVAFTIYFMWHRKRYMNIFSKVSKVKKGVAIAAVLFMVVYEVMSMGSWWIQPYISKIPGVTHRDLTVAYDEEDGSYSIQMENNDFKILQITDVHLGGSAYCYMKDESALQAVYDLINASKPDLVIVTGDFVFPMGLFSFSLNNYTPIMQFASFMRNIGIPWAFTYGNHDTEVMATHTENEINSLFADFSYTNNSNLLYSAKQPDITGRYNQLIKLLNPDGSINQVLFLLDSNSYQSSAFNDYDYIHDDQVEWYETKVRELSKENGSLVHSLMFFHIPLQEYQTAYDLYKKKDPSITYYFGKIGEENESICASEHSSKLFDKIVDLQSTQGIFVGHDHYNNISLGYKGVRLTYGMSIDYLAMPGIYKKTEQRGATEITIHPDSSFDCNQLPLTSIQS